MRIRESLYANSPLTQAQRDEISDLIGLSEYQRQLIIEIAQMDFECGQFTTKEFFLEDEEGDFPGVEKEAAEFYNDLIELGPAGMLEDYPELNWSDEFIAEYGDPDDEDEDEYDEDEEPDSDEELKMLNMFIDDDLGDSERLDEQYPIDAYKKDYEDYRKSLNHGLFDVIDDFLDKIDDKRVAKAVGKIVGEYYDELKDLSEKDRFNRVCDLIEEKYPKLQSYMNAIDPDKFELPKKGRVQVSRSLADIKFDESKSRRNLKESKINSEDLPFTGPNNVIDYLKKYSKFENVEPFQHSENNSGFYFEANGQRYRVYKETSQMPRKWQGYVIETDADRISDKVQLYRGTGYTELLADLNDLQKEVLGKTFYESKRKKQNERIPSKTIRSPG